VDDVDDDQRKNAEYRFLGGCFNCQDKAPELLTGVDPKVFFTNTLLRDIAFAAKRVIQDRKPLDIENVIEAGSKNGNKPNGWRVFIVSELMGTGREPDHTSATEAKRYISEVCGVDGLKYDIVFADTLDDADRAVHKYKTTTSAGTNPKTRIEAIRGEKLPRHEKNQAIVEIILQDLTDRGAFYFNEHSTYFFDRGSKKLTRIGDRGEDFRHLINGYGINPADDLFRWVHEGLAIEAKEHGTKTKIHQLAYYNPETFTIYRYNHSNQMYKITPEGDPFQLVDNGSDGVLFLTHRKADPFKAKPPSQPGLLDRAIIRYLHLDEDESYELSIDDRVVIFECWFYGLFFDSIMPTKVIMVFLGPAGAGKSSMLRMVAMLLMGPRYNVTPITKDSRDFDAKVTNSPIAFFDNVDSRPYWLLDRLAQVATGIDIEKRRLYTDNDTVSYPVNCFLGLTSRTPNFRRDDVADRLLLMRLAPIKDRIPEKQLLDELREMSGEIHGEINLRLQEIVRHLKGEKDTKETVAFRMADFAAFALKLARLDGREEMVREIFEKMTSEQAEFSLEGEPIAEVLDMWLDENDGRAVETETLRQELQGIAEKHQIKLGDHATTAPAFRSYIGKLRKKLETRYDIDRRTNNRRRVEWVIQRKTE
jgi:hypothetical protein